MSDPSINEIRNTELKTLIQRSDKKTPPSKEHIDGLKRYDDYGLSKDISEHISRVKKWSLYTGFVIGVTIIVVVAFFTVAALCIYMRTILDTPSALSNYVLGAKTVLLTVLSTLFVHQALTKEKPD